MGSDNSLKKLIPVQPKVILIGSGNVATQLGRALIGNGFPILQVFSKNETHAKTLANQLNSTHSSDIKTINQNADWYIIAVKDDAVEEVANQFNVGNKIVSHTSGTVSIDVLKNTSSNFGVFYPLQTFSKDRQINWRGTPFCIEGSNANTETFLEKAANDISGNVQKLDTEQRRWAHLAAVWGNNFTNFMLTEAESICNAHNIPFSILKPLLEETIDKAFINGPSHSQTGPAIRHDEHTIQNHLKMLDGDKMIQDIYIKLSEGISGLIN